MAARVVVVGLGPGDPGLITAAAREAIDAIAVRFLRTGRHPSASAVPDAVTFDDVYEQADSFDEVYATVVATLAGAARHHGVVLYGVPGSPLVAERTVELLRAEPDLTVEIHPALSFVDLAWDRLGVDPFAVGACLVDGHRFAIDAAGQTGPLLVAQCDRPHVLSDIKLAVEGDPGSVIVLQRLGLPDEAVTEVAWADLDRDVRPDHLTCLWIPTLAEPVAAELVALVELVQTLRVRCPWDREQTHASLARHLLEETYEVLDAIDGLPAGAGALEPGAGSFDSTAGVFDSGGGDLDPVVGIEIDPAWDHLEEELGDLLFQVVFHAQLGREAGRFGLADVARGVHDKLVERHPHVFGSSGATTVGELNVSWEQRKKREKGRASITDGIPATLPALAYAEKLQRKAASLGLDWPDAGGVWDKVDEELGELRQAVSRGVSTPPSVAPSPPRSGVSSVAPSPPPSGVSSVAPSLSPSGSPSVAPGAESDSPADASADEVEAELGDVLFSVVNLGRKLGVEAETAMRAAALRFKQRVMFVEQAAADAGIEPATAGADRLDEWWEEAKAHRLGGS